ncbi:hypothetical protein [Donghicola tyrosinivorans]|uniref:Uncharacterized protein n=1 Tax=Donghicola tyrosinivorans TaxID=1652492 RepID=A0A2T0X5S7_9RHOB|nr:hypothetical protein [Donghicola tyrosinivorans]PRY94286.1 hypothetical protein CLV74_101423 [Donghicola tyrosinivorans]
MEAFLNVYEKLNGQCRYYSRHLGHLKALIENSDYCRVVDGSMTGRVLLLGNSEITNALVLFNTRMLDTDRDAISIFKLARHLPENKAIQQHHNARMIASGMKYSIDRYFLARTKFIAAQRKLRSDDTVSKLRSLRNYTLAHHIEPEVEPERATLNDLLQLTEAVIGLVELAGYIVTSSLGVYRDFSARAEKETKMLYAALPTLANVEKELN